MKHRIVVLGAGYAGAHAAGRLARRLHADDVEITMVNADPDFVERVRLHQVATGQELRRRPLAGVFAKTGVTVRAARVTAVDVGRRIVELDDGEIAYDTLVYALGSTVADQGVPGAAEHAYHLASRPAALRLLSRLDKLAAGTTVLIVGGGLTAVEAATEIAESRPDLNVAMAAQGGVGDWLGEKAQRHLRVVLDRLGIAVHSQADVARVDENGVITAAGDRLAAGLTVWTAGFATHPIAGATALEVSDSGRIVVDETMRSVSHPDVYACGDAALAAGVGGKPLRMSCASGIPMGWQAADAIAARLTGRTVTAKPIPYFAQCISLGRRDGIIQPVTPDDQARSSAVTGRLAARLKEFVCAGAGWSVAHPTILMPIRRRRLVPAAKAELSLPRG